MHLRSVTLLSSDVEKLSNYYKLLFDKDPDFSRDDRFRQFSLGDMQVNIWAKGEFYDVLETGKKLDVSIVEVNSNQVLPAIINFKIEDIEKHYKVSVNKGLDILKKITEQPWEYISYWIRDPEGNILNFFQEK